MAARSRWDEAAVIHAPGLEINRLDLEHQLLHRHGISHCRNRVARAKVNRTGRPDVIASVCEGSNAEKKRSSG
jgi:hypothetical protein